MLPGVHPIAYRRWGEASHPGPSDMDNPDADTWELAQSQSGGAPGHLADASGACENHSDAGGFDRGQLLDEFDAITGGALGHATHANGACENRTGGATASPTVAVAVCVSRAGEGAAAPPAHVVPNFSPAKRFLGARPGMVFKTGHSGLGFYRDNGVVLDLAPALGRVEGAVACTLSLDKLLPGDPGGPHPEDAAGTDGRVGPGAWPGGPGRRGVAGDGDPPPPPPLAWPARRAARRAMRVAAFPMAGGAMARMAMEVAPGTGGRATDVIWLIR